MIFCLGHNPKRQDKKYFGGCLHFWWTKCIIPFYNLMNTKHSEDRLGVTSGEKITPPPLASTVPSHHITLYLNLGSQSLLFPIGFCLFCYFFPSFYFFSFFLSFLFCPFLIFGFSFSHEKCRIKLFNRSYHHSYLDE